MKEVERPLTKIKRLYFGGNTAKKKKKNPGLETVNYTYVMVKKTPKDGSFGIVAIQLLSVGLKIAKKTFCW